MELYLPVSFSPLNQDTAHCFLYLDGQTSSGKTHTMIGGGGERGILELAAETIFNQIGESENRDFLLRVSFVEIYNENIRDLLSDATDTSVNIRVDPRKGVYCETTEVAITDFSAITKALKKGAHFGPQH